MTHIVQPRPMRPGLRLSSFVSFPNVLDPRQKRSDSPSSSSFEVPPSSFSVARAGEHRPTPLDLTGFSSPPSFPTQSRSPFSSCFCSSRPPTPSLSCDLCNPYPSSPTSPLSPALSTSTWSSSSASSNPRLSPEITEDPSILFEFFSIFDPCSTFSSPDTSRGGSPVVAPVNVPVRESTVGTPIISKPSSPFLPLLDNQEPMSEPLLEGCKTPIISTTTTSKKRERDGKFKWRNWVSKNHRSSKNELDKDSGPPSRTMTRNPFSRLSSIDSL
ncbi:hypothetical protein JCM16303_000466 [Sporobolomyces ruberrimus]